MMYISGISRRRGGVCRIIFVFLVIFKSSVCEIGKQALFVKVSSLCIGGPLMIATNDDSVLIDVSSDDGLELCPIT